MSRLTATNLAVYHHNHCELYLWNTYRGKPALFRKDVADEPAPLTKAHFERGNEWERSLISWLDREGLLLALGAPLLTGEDLTSLVQLEERNRFFVYGLKFQSPNFDEDFERYGNGSRRVNFGVAKPDLVEFTRTEDGHFLWQVVDAKASKRAKVFISLLDVG
jgi:hypothetical protein